MTWLTVSAGGCTQLVWKLSMYICAQFAAATEQ